MMLRSKSSRSGSVDLGQKNQPSVLSRTFSASKFCRGDALVSQIDSNALRRKSVDRYPSKFDNSSENRIKRGSTMQEQMGHAEYELKGTRDQFVLAEEERNGSINELKEAKRLAFAASMKVSEVHSPRKAGDLTAEIKNLKELLSRSQEDMKMKDQNIESLEQELQRLKQFEAKLAEKDASLVRSKEEFSRVKMSEAHAVQMVNASRQRIQILEDEVQRGNVSEARMLDSLASQTKQLAHIKLELEESKFEISTLNEKIAALEGSPKHINSIYSPKKKRDSVTPKTERSANKFAKESPSKSQEDESKSSVDEIQRLKNELKLAIEAEEKSKKAMDDLAMALKEVATEAHQAKEKLNVAHLELEHVKGEAEQLKTMVRNTEERYEKLLSEAKAEAELQTNTADRLRVEAEESLLAWNGKEMGFVGCIKRAEEERAVLQHENSKLSESLKAAEPKIRAAREENFKLRDILKQALNESNAAKAAAGLARDENSYLKDCLAEKEEALHFLVKENERLRINEAAANENVKEFKRLLAASTELKAPDHDKDGILRSQSLNIEIDEDKKVEKTNITFNLDELNYLNDSEDSDNTCSHEDPEKAEALKGSIFDPNTDSPRSEPRTPKPVPHHTRDSSVTFIDDVETAISEDLENPDSTHFDESDSDRNHRRRRTMLRRVGDLLMRKSFHKREASTTE